VTLVQAETIRFMLDAFANHVQLALEPRCPCGFRLQPEVALRADEHLLDDRLGRQRRSADTRVGCRNQPPAEHLLSFFFHDPLDQQPTLLPFGRDPRQKHESGAVLACGGKCNAERCGDPPEKSVGRLDQNAGTISCIRFAAARATVQQVDEDLQTFLDDGMRPASLDVDDEADAAGVVLVAWVVQTRGGRWSGDRLVRHNSSRLRKLRLSAFWHSARLLGFSELRASMPRVEGGCVEPSTRQVKPFYARRQPRSKIQ
jgi:hypothetical protein